MFQTAAGVTVPFPEKLSEQYQRNGDTLTCNLSFEKLPDFVRSFYAELEEPLFLAIHPDAESDEVWYLDGMTKKQLTLILDGYGELLYQDGLSAFAIETAALKRCSSSSAPFRPRTLSPRGIRSRPSTRGLPRAWKSRARRFRT